MGRSNGSDINRLSGTGVDMRLDAEMSSARLSDTTADPNGRYNRAAKATAPGTLARFWTWQSALKLVDDNISARILDDIHRNLLRDIDCLSSTRARQAGICPEISDLHAQISRARGIFRFRWHWRNGYTRRSGDNNDDRV